MKSFIFKSIIILFFISLGFFCNASSPPPPPGGHGATGNQCATKGAPVESGVFILLGLAMAYGGRMIYSKVKKVNFQK